MPGMDATQVVVAGTGNVYAAPEGTALPVDIVTPLASPWVDMGYVSEDGVTFTISRESEDINAWQSMEPVRVVSTSEPKTIGFELLQFEPETVMLALRGGTLTTGVVVKWVPPDPGASDIRALVIDGIDGDEIFRFMFSRVQISGDVEWNLVRTNAIRLPLEFGVLAPTEGDPPWAILTDSEDWGATAVAAAAANGGNGERARATAGK